MFLKTYSYSFLKLFYLYFFPILSLFSVGNSFGLYSLKMPFVFFYLNTIKRLSFSFLKKSDYHNFITSFINLYNKMSYYYFLRLRIKGLGFRIRKMATSLLRFYFGSTNFIYFHMPLMVMAKIKKRQILLISHNYWCLKVIAAHLLLLRELRAYFLRGVMYPRRIFLLRVGKKKT